MVKKFINIAIDGPSGAGKSTISKAVAEKLGYIYIDTGALYRAVGYYALTKGVNLSQSEQICALLPQLQVEIIYEDGVQKVLVNGTDVSGKIRTPEVSMAASAVSAVPQVREFLFDLQKNLAKSHNAVMDGSDIGTVVLPQADVKIFLTADARERARRRYEELLEKGEKTTYENVLQDVQQRDFNDSNRSTAPLKQAEDAILVDTTGNSLEQSIQQMLNVIQTRLRGK